MVAYGQVSMTRSLSLALFGEHHLLFLAIFLASSMGRHHPDSFELKEVLAGLALLESKARAGSGFG